jgi:Glycosyltransferase Family 4/Glycosyl transferases group 1
MRNLLEPEAPPEHRTATAVGRPVQTAADVRGLRVLVLTNMYPTEADPSFGCFVRDQVDDLRRLGVEAAVVAFDGRTRKRSYLEAAPRVRRALRNGRFDLVHAHYGLSGAAASLQLRMPVVTTFHGTDAHVPWQRGISWLVARRTYPIAVAPAVASNLGLRDAAIIPCAVDLDAFAPVDQVAARRALGWPTSGHCVLFPASRNDYGKVRNKRPDIFDEIVARLRSGRPDVYPASLDGLDRAQVVLAMNAANTTVMTSMWEGAPVVVKESLACRTPVVSVAVGDVPDLLAGLPGCSIVPRDPEALANAVERALSAGRDPRLRDAMQVYGREPIAQRVLRVYHSLLFDRPAG